MAKRNTISNTRIDAETKIKVDMLRRKMSIEQGVDIKTAEVFRRMGKARSFEMMEKELIEDAKAKKRLGIK